MKNLLIALYIITTLLLMLSGYILYNQYYIPTPIVPTIIDKPLLPEPPTSVNPEPALPSLTVNDTVYVTQSVDIDTLTIHGQYDKINNDGLIIVAPNSTIHIRNLEVDNVRVPLIYMAADSIQIDRMTITSFWGDAIISLSTLPNR